MIERYASRDDQVVYHRVKRRQVSKLLRDTGENGGLTAEKVDAILLKEQKQPNSLKLADSPIRQYFPASYTPKQMQSVIVKLLKGWHKKKAG